MIDGGHLWVALRRSQKPFTPDYIEKVALACNLATEEIFRILYYDCPPFTGETKLPVSKQKVQHTGNAHWLHELGRKDLFAVRQGVVKFRGYVVRNGHQPSSRPQDSDFEPKFEQTGVDMRIGLDMALFSANHAVELIALMTNDTHCIPAMKYARRAGIQVALIELPGPGLRRSCWRIRIFADCSPGRSREDPSGLLNIRKLCKLSRLRSNS